MASYLISINIQLLHYAFYYFCYYVFSKLAAVICIYISYVACNFYDIVSRPLHVFCRAIVLHLGSARLSQGGMEGLGIGKFLNI